MEKDQKRGPLAVIRRRFVAAPILAGVVFLGQAGFQSEGHEPYVPVPIPEDQFKPLNIPDDTHDKLSHILEEATLTPVPIPEKILTKKELKKQELEDKRIYWYGFAQESGKFNDSQLETMWTYIPYYIAAGEKFDVDWKVLYINHQRESGGSAKNSKAFDGSTYPNVGGMQLNINYWTPEYQKHAVEDGENLSFLEDIFSTRHKGDMESIFAAAKMIGNNEDVSFKKTHSQSDSIRFGFVRFTGSLESGEARYQEYRAIEQIFKNQIEEAIFSQNVG